MAMQIPWAFGMGYDDRLTLGVNGGFWQPAFGALRRDGNAAEASSLFELPSWRNPGHPPGFGQRAFFHVLLRIDA